MTDTLRSVAGFWFGSLLVSVLFTVAGIANWGTYLVTGVASFVLVAVLGFEYGRACRD